MLVALVAALCCPRIARADAASSSARSARQAGPNASAAPSIESAPVASLEPPVGPGAAVGGIALALVPGLGLGHAVIGEYADHGWKFTLGEAAGLAAFVGGLSMCDCLSVQHEGPGDERGNGWGAPLALIGLGTYGVLRVIEIVDVLSLMSERNRAYNESMASGGLAPSLYALPGGGGVTLRGEL